MEESTAAAIARMEEQIKNLDRRMGNLEKLTESVQSLALSVQQLATQQSSTESDVEALTAEVAEGGNMMKWDWKKFLIAALIRALRTFAQTFVGFIAVGAALDEIQWLRALSVSGAAAVLSVLTSIATGLPEVDKEPETQPPIEE